jgi:hypothetical protein
MGPDLLLALGLRANAGRCGDVMLSALIGVTLGVPSFAG